MDFSDLDEARAIYSALLEVFVAHTGGKSDPEALRRAQYLCDAATSAVDDVDCRVAIRGVKSYSALLFSADGTKGLDSGSMSGLDYLRLHISNALSAFRGRLNMIENERLRRRHIDLELRRQRANEPPALSGELTYEPADRRGIKVLVVEDNRDSAETLRELLYHSGYEVALAFTGQEGVRAAKRMRPDVVLCDIGLPDGNGFAVASALRNDPDTAGARIIAVTAYGQEHDRRRALESGFDVHLVKPVDPGVLLKKLSS